MDTLRKNIKAMADAERSFGKAMKKLASATAPVRFSTGDDRAAKSRGGGSSKSQKGDVDTLVAATNVCFSSCPQQ